MKGLSYRGAGGSMIELADLLDLVGGTVPLLIEIKSEWEAPDMRFLQAVAATAAAYRGPIALMSFDPAVMTAIRGARPAGAARHRLGAVPRGDCWWRDKLGPERAYSSDTLA